MRNEQVKDDLNALFVRMGLATVENNRGLGVVPSSQSDSWLVKLMGHAIAYEHRPSSDFANTKHVKYENRTFFKVGKRNGELRISAFVTIDFSFLTEWWQKRLAPGVLPVNSLGDVREAYELLVQYLDGQLSLLGKEVNADNRIYLLNFIMAFKQNCLPLFGSKEFTTEVPYLAIPMLEWWEAGIPVEYTLHFFNPHVDGGFIKSGNLFFSETMLDAHNGPALSLEQAKEAAGISITKLRLLYPNGAERF